MDAGQYSVESIRKYERIYGKDFISPGGADLAREFIDPLGVQSGERVLDAGCGIGGAAFLMARDFRALVEGIDLSTDMIEQAKALCRALQLEAK